MLIDKAVWLVPLAYLFGAIVGYRRADNKSVWLLTAGKVTLFVLFCVSPFLLYMKYVGG